MWPIPKVPEKSTIANLSYKRWGIVLISMLIVCAALGFSFWGAEEYKKIGFFLLLQTLNVHGQQVETVGIPLHWGFEGVAQKGYIANTLTPNVGDSNSQTPEYKAFLVNIEKA